MNRSATTQAGAKLACALAATFAIAPRVAGQPTPKPPAPNEPTTEADTQGPARAGRAEAPTEAESEASADDEDAPDVAQDDRDAQGGFGARAQVARRTPGQKRVTLRETRSVPGALGDPFRATETLPGVVPVASGLPYGYVRGAPPATVGYTYDGIPVPLLYHLALGPAAIHPRMLGPISFYAGAPPARFGRRLGGSLAAEGPAPGYGTEGEVELRLLDVNGYVRTPVGAGSLQVAGRYGAPGLVLGLFNPESTLAYWDYQTRFEMPISDSSMVQAVAFGSFDALRNPPWGDEEDRFNEVELQFHRLELRLIRKHRATEVGAAVRVGYDDSAVDRELAVKALTLGPRMWLRTRLNSQLRLHLGADMLGSVGSIDSIQQSAPLQVAGRRQVRAEVPLFADAAARSAGGAFAEVNFDPSRHLSLELGLRWDVWLVEGEPSHALDPRLRATYFATDALRFHAAAGLTHQPAVFLVPIPGLTEVALDRGLQEAVQSETGVELDLPASLSLETQVFVHRYFGMLLPELYAPDEGEPAPEVNATSYGVEVFLKRAPTEHLSGWVSYTLGWAEAYEAPDGTRFAPEFDIRHVLNVVLQYRLDMGLSFGSRLHARSGRPFNRFDVGTTPTYEVRLPGFVRLDARVSYEWTTSFAAMQAYVEWLNVTLAEEALGAECFFGRCSLQTAPAIFLPNAGLRASF